MQIPYHAIVVHFPIALTIILPFLVLIFALMLKKNKITPNGWLIIVGLQALVTISGYTALKTGEAEEEIVQRVVEKKLIHEHEEAAEIFIGSTVVILALSIAVFFLRAEIQFYLHMGIAVLGFVSCFLVYNTASLGGALVYEHGAASAYAQVIASPQEEPEGILPTPGENTSETPIPTSENESLKTDENDYGSSDDLDETEDEFSKQED